MSTEPTNEAIRLACAEAMGWRWERPYNKRLQSNRLIPPAGSKTHRCIVWKDGSFGGTPPPNYPEDDKAARELRMSLTEEEQTEFVLMLLEKFGLNRKRTVEGNVEITWLWDLVDASPRDQAIAFLRVKGVEI